VPQTSRQSSSAPRITTVQLAEALAGIEQRIDGLAAGLEVMAENNRSDSERIWTALGTTGGLDGVSIGLAEIAELLGPLRSLAPPATAQDLRPGVAETLGDIRVALGGRRDTNFAQVTTDWDSPVGFIGQVDPSVDYPTQFDRQVAS
jgi:hypothetical protein